MPLALCRSDRAAPWRRSPGDTYETHARPGLRDGENTADQWHRGLVEFHVLANAGQLLQSAPEQAHSLAGAGSALAFHAHALAAGGAVGVGRIGGGGGFGRAIVHLFIWH